MAFILCLTTGVFIKVKNIKKDFLNLCRNINKVRFFAGGGEKDVLSEGIDR